MKILTAAQMAEVDRRTIEAGIPGLILMENAGSRVVDFLAQRFAPLSKERVVVFCGKGNNGGDGFVIARQLFTRKLCASIGVVEIFDSSELTGDALASRRMLAACGCPIDRELRNEAIHATLIVDAVLGTGLKGPARGPALDAIRWINEKFPFARKVAVDLPSGLPSDETKPTGEFVQVNHTVTFTAPKLIHCLSHETASVGEVVVVPIGTPDAFCDSNPNYPLRSTTPADLRCLFAPRPRDSNKGKYGHVVVIGGTRGKSGAPTMTGLASYRSGAGLVTVAISADMLNNVAMAAPELMTQALEEITIPELLKKKTVLALGPGLGESEAATKLARDLYATANLPAVVDADALNALDGNVPVTDKIRVLTPHPGEMARLVGKSIADVQAGRLVCAQDLARRSQATIVLKGDRTVIAFPDGDTWINPTGSPAMAKGGTGDVLTGMLAGMMAQFPANWKLAVVAAVWMHGRSGELCAAATGDQFLMATDLLHYLPKAIDELRPEV